MSPTKLSRQAGNKGGALQVKAASAAAAAPKGGARAASERSPQQNHAGPAKQPRGAGTASRSLFAAPQAPPAAIHPAPTEVAQPAPPGEEDEVHRAFSTPDGRTFMVPPRFASDEEDLFSYKAGYVEGRTGKTFAQVFDAKVFARDAFFQGYSDAVTMTQTDKDSKLATPEILEERAGPVKKADIQTYIDKAKGGKLSAILKNHIFGDAVMITRGAEVIFDFARPFFIRGGDEGELKAVASHFLLVELGKAYDLNDFKDAWDSGCEVEVVTKTRKADLAGVDKARVKTTVKQITLKAELKVMVCNARSALAAKIFGVYRFTFGLPPRPKGEQNVAGKKAAKILDPAWEVHSKEMSIASLKESSRYGAPFTEGQFNVNPDEDKSLDPVGQLNAVLVLANVFKGLDFEEYQLREKIDAGELLAFSMLEIAIFITVIQDKIKALRRGATCTAGSFDDQVKDTMKFLVAKFKRYGWTAADNNTTPALTKLIRISDYPVSARPLLAEDDKSYWFDHDGITLEKAVMLAGEKEAPSGTLRRTLTHEGDDSETESDGEMAAARVTAAAARVAAAAAAVVAADAAAGKTGGSGPNKA